LYEPTQNKGIQMKTIIITGTSSGFGLETAKYFLDHNWKVIATMRNPQDSKLPQSPNLRVMSLDVSNPESIRQLVEGAGPVDVLVNNAGIGFMNALEGTSMDTARAIFETNTIGTMAMTQAILPQFRERKVGVIINVTSSVTLKSLPMLSVYTASKAAVNAFTESLALELQPFNIRVSLVLPGRAPGTRFGENARALMTSGFPDAYADFAKNMITAMQSDKSPVTQSQDVVAAVWRAAIDPSSPLRIPAGADAVALSDSH
jgi:NAD(P)-dependent dehydrogenase (short-subunit alcohol dehydrogenase family)